jgi:cobalt-zinc-cadmium efflux system membrane fusion protein
MHSPPKNVATEITNEPSSNSKAWILLGLIFLILLLGFAECGRSSRKEETAVPPAQVTQTSVEFARENPQLNAVRTIEAQPFREAQATFTGQLVWREDHTDRVFSPVAGRVEAVVAQLGQQVHKGDDLALMRSPDYAQAQADYRKAVSDLAQSEKTLARVSALSQHGAAAIKDVESAQADYERNQSEKQRAELRLQLLGSEAGKFSDVYHLVAPIDGVVVDRNINVGQEIRADIILAGTPQLTAPMFVITDPSSLWVQLDVPEQELSKLIVGQPVEVRTAAYPDRVFGGGIDNVGAFLDPQTRVAHARASVANAEGLLKAAMYVDVDVKELPASQTEVVLPSRAVFFLDGKYYVFLQTHPLTFEKREVTVDRDAPGEMIAVRGLRPKDRVASEGNLLLNEMLLESQPGQSQPDSAHQSQ